MDEAPAPEELCTCGHRASEHGPTQRGECQAEDCECGQFVPAEEE